MNKKNLSGLGYTYLIQIDTVYVLYMKTKQIKIQFVSLSYQKCYMEDGTHVCSSCLQVSWNSKLIFSSPTELINLHNYTVAVNEEKKSFMCTSCKEFLWDKANSLHYFPKIKFKFTHI